MREVSELCAVRTDRKGGATHVLPIGRWVGRPRLRAPANDNRSRKAVMGPGELILAIGWRLTLGVGGLGLIAATACLFAAA